MGKNNNCILTYNGNNPFSVIANTVVDELAKGHIDMNALGIYTIYKHWIDFPDWLIRIGHLEKHCSNGEYSFDAAGRKLRESGLLRQFKMILAEENKKTTFLYDYDVLDMPCSVNLRGTTRIPTKDVQRFINQRKDSNKQRRENALLTGTKALKEKTGTAMPNEIIANAALSLAAKGLFIIIKHIFLTCHRTIYKEDIKRACNGDRKFKAAWNELKEKGYFKIKQYNGKNGFEYEFELLDVPELETAAFTYVKPEETIKAQNKARYQKEKITKKVDKMLTSGQAVGKQGAPIGGELPEAEEEFIQSPLDIAIEDIKMQVEYDVLEDCYKSGSHPFHVYFPEKEFMFIDMNMANTIISIMAEEMTKNPRETMKIKEKWACKRKQFIERMRIMDFEHLLRLTDDLSDRFNDNINPIRDPYNYILSAIYNSIFTPVTI